MKFEKNGWIVTGLIWGVIMFIGTTFGPSLLRGEEVTPISIAIGLPIWLIGGLGWGYFMKKFMAKQGKREGLRQNRTKMIPPLYRLIAHNKNQNYEKYDEYFNKG